MELQYRQEADRSCCGNCSLHPQYTGSYVWYTPTEVEGPVDVFCVFEAPGADEDHYVDPHTQVKGRPVIGPAGQMHRSCMQEAGIIGNYALGNVCKCRPLHNKTPTPPQVQTCLPYLLEEIERLKPKVVVCCGGTAIKALMPELGGLGVLKSQGRFLERDDVIYIANTHPSFVIRQQDPKAKALRKEQYVNVLRTATKIIKQDPSADWLKPGVYFYADTLDKVRETVDAYLETPAVEGILAFDTETLDGLNRFKNRVSMMQFSNDGLVTVLIPFIHPEAPWTPEELEQVKLEIIRLFTTPTTSFAWIVGSNLKFDLAMLKTCVHPDLGTGRMPLNASLLDTMFLAHSVDEQRLKRIPRQDRPMSLARLARDFLGWTGFDESGMKDKRDQFDKIPLSNEEFREYCAMDGYVPHRLARALLHLADKEEGGRERVFRFNRHLHGPLLEVFESIERNGFCVDVEHLRYLCGPQSPIKTRMGDIKKELYALPKVKEANERHLQKTKVGNMVSLFGAPWVLDIDKKASLITLLLDTLGLEPLGYGKPKIGPNGEEIPEPKIDTDFFERYRSPDDLEEGVEVTPEQHIIDLIYEYKGLYKLDTSYTKSVYKRIHDEGSDGECADGRARTSFTSCFVTSGRTSSEHPNFQQIPSSKGRISATNAARKAVKNMYCVPDGRLLVQMDVKQSEVRHVVNLARDLNYAKVFHNMVKIEQEFVANSTPENKQRVKFECDIHRQTAALMNQIPIADVTPLQRQAAKRIVFGLLYGQHITTLAKNLGIEVDKAQELMDTFFNQFPKVKDWLDWAVSFARANGYIDSPMGRRRHLDWAYSSGDPKLMNRADRQAKNCITGDSLIPTTRGLVPISEIEVGDKVATPFGYNDVLAKVTSGTKDVCCATTKVGYSITGTGDHPVLVWNEQCSFEWKGLQELREGDVLVYRTDTSKNLYDVEEEPSLAEFSYDTAEGYESRSKYYKLPERLNPDLAEILGAVISEGCLRLGVITYTNKDINLLNNFRILWQNVFGEVLNMPLSVQENTKEGAHVLNGYSRQLSTFFQWLGVSDKNAHEKEIPWVVLRTTQVENVRRFLKGLFEGDGCFNKRGISYYSSSEKLIDQLQTLLLSYGIIAAKHVRTRLDTHTMPDGHVIKHNHPEYSLVIQGKDQDRLASFLYHDEYVCERTLQSRRGHIPYLKELYYKRLKRQGRVPKGRWARPIGCSEESRGILTSTKVVKYPNVETLTDDELDNIALFASDVATTLNVIRENNLRFTPVVAVEALDEPAVVWDIQVRNSESFIANGLAVHNSPIQVISSDYNLLAGIRLQKYIEKNDKDWMIVNLVHDSIISDIPYSKEALREYIETAEKIFTDTSVLKEMFGIDMIVPLAVDFDIGFKYGECKGFDRSEKNFEEIWAWLEQQVEEGTAWPKQATKVWN